MKNKYFVLFGAILISIVIYLFVSAYFDSIPEEKTTSTSAPEIAVNYSNFAGVMSKNAVVKAIPDETAILLRFYNFDSGERTYEKSYLITRGNIVEGLGETDVVLSLHSKYLDNLTNRNFCSVVAKANENGELGFETNLSSTALAWKMKSMYKYKSCLGL